MLAGGKSLAESMAAHPQVFRPLHIAMVKAGEIKPQEIEAVFVEAESVRGWEPPPV